MGIIFSGCVCQRFWVLVVDLAEIAGDCWVFMHYQLSYYGYKIREYSAFVKLFKKYVGTS